MEAPKLSFTVSDHEQHAESYDRRIEQYRVNNDFMWRFMNASEKEFQRGYLRDLCVHLREQYGSKGSKRKLSEEALAVFEWAVNESDNPNLMHCLWFFGLYLFPGLPNWMIRGDVTKGIAPPPLPNPVGFQYFVGNKLPKFCDELLSGKGGMDINSFVRFVRAEYFSTLGLADPPVRLRTDFEDARSMGSQIGTSIALVKK